MPGYRIDAGQMPRLDHLPPLCARLVFRHCSPFSRSPAWRDLNPQVRGLVLNFARLVDLAAAEYEAGRTATTREWGEDGGSLVAALTASGHFETCVTAVHRAVVHAKAMRTRDTAPPWLWSFLPPGAEVLSGDGDARIGGMRDVVHHLEARILGVEPTTGKELPPWRPMIRPGEPVALMVDGDERQHDDVTVWTIDRLELGGHRIALADLARWVGELHDLAREMVERDEA